MTEEFELTQKREELKRQLAVGECKTSMDVMLDGIGHFIQKLTRGSKPPPFWYSAVVLILVPLSASLLISFLLGEFNAQNPKPLLLEILVAGMILAVVIIVKIYLDSVFATWHNNLLNAIESYEDLTNLQRWFAALCDAKKQIIFGVAYGVVVGSYGLIWAMAIIGGGGFGFPIFLLLMTFLAGIHIYYLFLFIALPVRFSRYQFKLYESDPSSSEVIDHLSDMLSTFVYIMAVSLALTTLLAGLLVDLLDQPLFTIPFVLVSWVPLTILFIVNQYALTRIITRAKWKKLNKIQAKIEALEAEKNIVDKDTMEAVNRLMDYHDRIKATRNSALDFRAGLNFANSLLLPLFAFVLGNLDNILARFN
jgi:hypothetical protein